MKIIKRVVFDYKDLTKEELSDISSLVKIKYDKSGLLGSFEIEEKSEAWRNIASVIEGKGFLIQSKAKWGKKDILNADWVTVNPRKLNIYPQPEDLYQDTIYSGFCNYCKIHSGQKSEFEFKDKPNLGRRKLFEIYWVEYEYFMLSSLWEEVFSPLGIPKRNVFAKSGNQLANIVQLDLSGIQPISFDLGKSRDESQVCTFCERKRLELYGETEVLPAPKSGYKSMVAVSKQWFGTQNVAFRYVMFRQELYRELLKFGVNPLAVHPGFSGASFARE